MDNINEVLERLDAIASDAEHHGMLRASIPPKYIRALLADHARLQRLEAALSDWSLAENASGTVGVVCRRLDGPGGDIELRNAGRFEQRLLHALVTDIATAQKEVQP